MQTTTLDNLRAAEAKAVEQVRATLPDESDTLAVRAALSRAFLAGVRFTLDDMAADRQHDFGKEA